MEKIEELEVRLELVEQKREALGKALDSARIAYDSIKYQHEAALKERDEIIQALIEALKYDSESVEYE